MRSEKELAAESDLLQAIECCAFLGAERKHLAEQSARLEALAAATLSTGGDVSGLRRTIRRVDSDLRQIDRMLEAIESRFPAAVQRRA
ncbi:MULTISPECIES: hypothetical protein [Mycolicibacterium]|uniref:hypothetical protein n=1 Tax=Mycolicibacterium TaxID=1866885 RepID=UPI00298C0D42|nr:hypothetical protein [Mycolicibacterium sp. D5.8-2]MDW5613730.1 hypothetical protein [Mycolicibacterium sp. D5.8-2]